jgi:acetylornithine deacetylase/succinyl-diaminopimelate desuccinylase-like protein
MPMNRRDLLGAAAATAAVSSLPSFAFAADDRARVYAEIEKRHGEAVQRLQDWVRNPTIAAEGRGLETGVAQMISLARDAGFQSAVKMPTSNVPGVFATLDAGAPKTVGLYFMYDVKQADPAEWTTGKPFDASIVDKAGFGKVLVGRGAVNQKGPESAFLAALHAFRGAGVKLPVNLVLVAEGEEEIGSPHIPEIVRKPEVLAALGKTMGVFMPGAGQDPDGSVQVSLGAKGVVEMELISSGAKWGRGPRRTSTPRTARASTAPPSTSSRRSRRS